MESIKSFFLDILSQVSSLILGTTYTRITKIKGDYTDKVGARAMVTVVYPKWCTWMHNTEELYYSEHGIIWYGEHSGEADTLGLNKSLWDHHARLQAKKACIPQLCDRCENEIVH